MTYQLINRPVEFPGSREEADENYATHAFSWDMDGDSRCWNCDSRPSYVAASYPCGEEPPRETIMWVESGETVAVSGEGTVDFVRDGSVSGVLTPPTNGEPVYLTGVDRLSFRLNGELKVEEAACLL